MIDDHDESSNTVNPWITFADMFAGLALIMIMGLGFLLSHRQDENVKFSQDLIRIMNRATDSTKQLQGKLRPLLPSTSSETEYRETEIVIPTDGLFAPFGFDAEPVKLKLLTDIRQALKETLDKAGAERRFLKITIEGHTDSDPIRLSAVTTYIPTNWELSSRRATGVLRFFEDGGISSREYNLVAVGLADTQPVAPNETDEGKSKNRRIVIRIEPDINKLRNELSAAKYTVN